MQLNLFRKISLAALTIFSISIIADAASDNVYELKSSSGSQIVTSFSNYYYVSFDMVRPETVTLISGKRIESVEIGPASAGITFKKNENSISFLLQKQCQLVVLVNQTDKVFIFADLPFTLPPGDKVVNIATRYGVNLTGETTETQSIQKALDESAGSGLTLYFPPGIYRSGQLRVRSNTSLFLARGAVLLADTGSAAQYSSHDEAGNKRFISISGVSNVIIRGHGSINGNGTYLRGKYGDDARIRLIMGVKSDNILIEGIILADPGSWNTHLLLCKEVTIRNVKLLNNVDVSNTDGFDPDASSQILIENCFACCGDDNVAVKITANSGLAADVDGVTVRNCLFLTRKSALKVGTETRGKEMKNILFENNDVIESDRGIAIYVNDGASLENITYRNNRFGRNFPDQQKKAIHITVSKRNSESKLGEIRSLLIDSCIFETKWPKKSVISYEGEGTGITCEIKNLVIAGEKINAPGNEVLEFKNSKVTIK